MAASRAQPRLPASEGGRAPGVDWATVGDAGVMSEVGYVPFGQWQRTWRAAHASDMTTIVEGSFGNVLTYLRLLEMERTFFGRPILFLQARPKKKIKKN